MSFRCQETPVLLEGRREKTLPETAARLLKTHLDMCRDCRRLAVETEPLILFRELLQQPLPPGVDQYILGGLRLEEGRRRTRPLFRPGWRPQPWSLAAASLLAAALLILWAFPAGWGGPPAAHQQAFLDEWEPLLLPHAMRDVVATVEDIRSPTAEVFAFSLSGETVSTEVILIVDRSIDL